VNVTPKIFIGWYRAGFRLFWRWKSRPGRPRIPAELHALIRALARDNPSWGEERIANELLLKLRIRISPRTVRKYLHKCVARTAAWRSKLVDLTIEVDPTAAWGRESRTRQPIFPSHHMNIGIGFRAAVRLRLTRYKAFMALSKNH
jgi:hypothetical protein